MPIIADTGSAQTQSQTQYLKLAATSGTTLTGSGVWTDYGAYITLLCSTSGTCCSTSLCNASNKIKPAHTNAALVLFISLSSILALWI